MTGSGTSPLPTATAVVRERTAYVTVFKMTQTCTAPTQDALEDQVMELLLTAAERAGGELHVHVVNQTSNPEPAREFILTATGETRPAPRPGPPVETPARSSGDTIAERLDAIRAAKGKTPTRNRSGSEDDLEGKTRIRAPRPAALQPSVSFRTVDLDAEPQQVIAAVSPVVRDSTTTAPLDAAPGSATASFLALHQARVLAERGVRGWCNRVLGTKLSPSRRERKKRAAIAAADGR